MERATAAAPAAGTSAVQLGKSGKKICCACPGSCALSIPLPYLALLTTPLHPFLHPTDTKKPRDACVIGKGEAFCAPEIEAHKACLREDGFKVT